MDNLWSRRSSGKLSLSTPPTNGSPVTSTDHPTRGYTMGRKNGADSSSHSNKNPFSALPSAGLSSPTAGAFGAFGFGTGAFASFGNSKAVKTNNSLDFGSVVKTPTTEKQLKGLGPRASKASLTDSKTSTATPPPAHNLRHSWVFWFRPPISKSNGFVEYEKTLHPMATFSTVEEFFSIYSHMKRPSTLPLVSDYHIFKKDIRPVWEDEENRSGGKWVVRLKKGVADRYWEDLLLAIIGDQFANATDEICGAVLSVRNGEDILSIWARGEGGNVLKLRRIMISILGMPSDIKVDWKPHESSIAQRSALDARQEQKNNQHNNQTSSRNGNDHSEKKSSA